MNDQNHAPLSTAPQKEQGRPPALAVELERSAAVASVLWGRAMSSIPPDDRSSSAQGGAPEHAGGRKRPRYLVVALVAALVFGAGCWTKGCSRLSLYRGETGALEDLNASIQDDAERARAEALYQRFVDTADMQRGRAIPMAAATFVLGAALLALAARGLTGRSNTRSPLMQVVAAQAIVVAASYFVTRDIWQAEAEWQYEMVLIQQREQLPPDQYAAIVPSVRGTSLGAAHVACPPDGGERAHPRSAEPLAVARVLRGRRPPRL